MTGNRNAIGEMGNALQNTDDAEILEALERGGQTPPPPARPKMLSDFDLDVLEECYSCHDMFLIRQVMLCDGGQILCGACFKQ